MQQHEVVPSQLIGWDLVGWLLNRSVTGCWPEWKSPGRPVLLPTLLTAVGGPRPPAQVHTAHRSSQTATQLWGKWSTAKRQTLLSRASNQQISKYRILGFCNLLCTIPLYYYVLYWCWKVLFAFTFASSSLVRGKQSPRSAWLKLVLSE